MEKYILNSVGADKSVLKNMVDSMVADALATCVVRTSVAMIL